MMSERLDWTQKLGEAFLAQEQDVMDAVQRMRAKAYDRKKLETTKEQVVSVKQEQNRQVISIDPAVPDTPLRSVLRTAGGLRRLAIRRLSGIPLLLGLPRLHRRRRDRDRSCLWRGLRARAMGARRILGRRRLLGRQPRQLGRRSHQRQSRRPRRALAAQSGAPRWCAIQQCGPATEVRSIRAARPPMPAISFRGIAS